jgi:hypothetical protein
MSSYQLETQRLNSAAVMLLTEGRYMEAIVSLTECMIAIKTEMKHQLANTTTTKSNRMMSTETEDNDDEDDDGICPCRFVYRRVDVSHKALGFRSSPVGGEPTNIAPATTTPPSTTTADGSHVYFDALEVTNMEYDQDCLHCEQSLVLAILFNLALSHHLNAAATSTVIDIHNNSHHPLRKDSLHKALRLYELAHHMATLEGSSSSYREAIVILNNLSLIHKEIGNDDYALQCQQQLLSSMMFLVDSGEDALVQELEGVLDNIMPLLLSSSHCSMAPAA